jgi:hypothetical protein
MGQAFHRLGYFLFGDNTIATRIETQSINEDKGILDVLVQVTERQDCVRVSQCLD